MFEKQSSSNRGGARPGAGRKAGVPNRRTAELMDAVEKSGITPLEYMLSVMRDESKDLAIRLDAAKSAAPYTHAKLSSIEMSANITSHEAAIDDLA